MKNRESFRNSSANSEFQLYKAPLERAHEYYRDSIYDGNRQLEVIYITKGSGTGKTTLAKHIAKKHGYSFFISGSDNDLGKKINISCRLPVIRRAGLLKYHTMKAKHFDHWRNTVYAAVKALSVW